jgi:N-acetylglucosamine kinase-like BadF-type ATPase
VSLYVGISGGHQTSTATAVRDGVVLGSAKGDGLNLHTVPHLKLASRTGALLENLADRISITPIELKAQTSKLVLAVPGAEIPYGQRLAEACLFLNDWTDRSQFFIVDDTWAGLIGGALRRRGICAFAGTGAAVYVGLGEFAANKRQKIDGWGHILGDYGSGYQLALKMFRFLGRTLDRDNLSPLFAEILSEDPRISDPDNIQHWFSQLYTLHTDDWVVRFARMAAVVTRAANRSEHPDDDACRFVIESAEEMVESVTLAVDRFMPESRELPIVFQGGMFEHNDLFRRTVAERLKQNHSSPVGMSSFRPVIGAALMACASDSMLPDNPLRSNILSSIQALPAHERALLAFPSALLDVEWEKITHD